VLFLLEIAEKTHHMLIQNTTIVVEYLKFLFPFMPLATLAPLSVFCVSQMIVLVDHH
jgi:hypothetical protein